MSILESIGSLDVNRQPADRLLLSLRSKIPKEWNGWEGPGGKPRRGIEFAEITFRAYEQVHVYEGPQKKPRK